ncbi:MAG: alpha-glucan family phosphorylase [Dehalococcoidales bacterium]|nr:MAG: alpha-glucan family phosphorylase [Dehalococcoidales bacterium]
MVTTKLPDRINRLDELANNLWWSWHEEARRLFRILDSRLWRMTVHNPVKQLNEAAQDTLQAAAKDPAFLNLYDSVMLEFDADMSSSSTWFANEYGKSLSGPIAFFSMEYAIHNSLPIYAGGLGALAGDICKEASELGLPLVAIGFMYPQGYFHQHISAEGWQEEVYQQLDFNTAPINRVLSPTGESAIAKVQLGNITIAIGVWKIQVGRTSIYLLDTNLEENPQQYRELSARLYVADREQRLQQEIVLGVGGVRVLRALNIHPAVWHANEGHTAFMMLERVRELVMTEVPFTEALSKVRATTVFTTHTPVMAGHDTFSSQLMEKYFKDYWKSLGVDREVVSQLGQQDNDTAQTFNMTTFALRMANQRCAVSQLHGRVTRKMWHNLWPQAPEDEVPITHITNGIHVPSWVAPEVYHLFERYMGGDWIEKRDDNRLWERVLDIPDEEWWAVHQLLKRKLIGAMREGARNRWVEDDVEPKQVLALGGLLNPETLTIGFARRFTEYKRPTLIFQDVNRLKRIINNRWRPVQIVFAGKSHPADFSSKHLLHRVYLLAADREFQGRIAFVEDYDMHMARYLVQGVDVWLNTPRRLQEACGTSGMKASLNGVPHLSVRDGWWHEAYDGTNGWAINSDLDALRPGEEDGADAETLYRLLEEEIAPLYYTRGRGGVPHGWIRMVKESIRSVVPVYSARRMLKEYTEKMYRVAAHSASGIERS